MKRETIPVDRNAIRRRNMKCPVCYFLKTFAGPMCASCVIYFEHLPNGKNKRRLVPLKR